MNGATPPSKEPFYGPILALYSLVKPWRHNFETKKGVYFSYTFAILLGTFGVAPQTLATPYTNTSGEICKSYYGFEANIIHYYDGTRSSQNGGTFVICPLSRDTTNSKGAVIYVDVRHDSSATTTCNAYSKGYTGNLMASNSQTWTGSGFHEFVLDIVGSGYSDLYSDYSVICLIPGYVGSVMGIDLSEQ